MKFYLHNSYLMSEIAEVTEKDTAEMTPEAKQTLCEEIYNLFYEVGFKIEFNRETGKVTKVVLDPTKYGQKDVFQ